MTKARSLSDFIESDGSVTLVDNQKIKVGTGNDLQIYHDSNNSYFANGTGATLITGSGVGNIAIKPKSDEDSIVAVPNGNVQLYYDGAKKLETTSTGVSVTGEIDLSDDINIVDGKAARFGTGEDFSIYNDGSNTYLRNSTINQDINFLGNDDGAANVTMLTLDASDGGTATFNHDVKLGDNGKAVFGSDSDLEIFYNGSNAFVQNHVGGGLYNRARTDFVVQTNATGGGADDAIKALQNGAVELYYDNSKKLETTTTGIKIGTGDSPVDGDANDLVIMNTSGGSGITVSSASNSVSSLRFGDADLARSGMFYYNHNDNSLRIDTAGSSRMFIYSNGMTTIDASSGSSIGNLRVKGTSGHSYIGVSRAAESQGEVGYTWNNNVTNMWWNYVAANSSILNWYSTTGTKMTLNNSSGDLNVTTGNVVMSNGKGIAFTSTTPDGTNGAAVSETLDDYEEGTCNFTEKNGQATITTNRGHYVKIGQMVTIWASVGIGSNSNGNALNLTLPFSSSINGYYTGGGTVAYHNLPTAQRDNIRANIENGASDMFFFYDGTSVLTCAQASGQRIDFIVSYRV